MSETRPKLKDEDLDLIRDEALGDHGRGSCVLHLGGVSCWNKRVKYIRRSLKWSPVIPDSWSLGG